MDIPTTWPIPIDDLDTIATVLDSATDLTPDEAAAIRRFTAAATDAMKAAQAARYSDPQLPLPGEHMTGGICGGIRHAS